MNYSIPVSAKRYHTKLVQMKKHKPLSEAVSEVRKLMRARCDGYDDVAAFCAPSECYGSIDRQFEGELQDIVKRHGFLSVEIFYDVVKARTTEKWAYFNLSI